MFHLVFLLAWLVSSSLGNRVLDVKSTCDKETFNVELHMEKPFKGLVFSKDFSKECRSQGNLDNKVVLQLPSNACGVRISYLNQTEGGQSSDLYYNVELIVQMDRQLQQFSDQEILVGCRLKPRATRINSSALQNVITSKIKEMKKHNIKNMRTGRSQMDVWINPPGGANVRDYITERSRIWMSLAPVIPTSEPAIVSVGELAKLTVNAALPVGVGIRVTNCIAHDGTGESSQIMLDEMGCPTDEFIFTAPIITKYKPEGSEIDFSELKPVDSEKNIKEINDPDSMLVYYKAETTFAAFKFPDKAILAFNCNIKLCMGECSVDCKALRRQQKSQERLIRKPRLDKDANGIVIDRLEVYNSIEVLAPNIELEDEASIRGSRRIEGEEDGFVHGFSPGDKTICMSPGKMALAFSVLGIIFLCALAVAFVSLIRARRRLGREPLHTSVSFYTGSKSMFSSSGSSSSGLSGSKLLLTDSPYMDQHSSSSNNWPYSRGF